MQTPPVHVAIQRAPTQALMAVKVVYDGTLQSDGNARRNTGDTYWAIDRSGSMDESMVSLNRALKAAWLCMARKPYLLPFNHQCQSLPTMRRMPNLTAEGGTSFYNAFVELIDVITRNKSTRSTVLFFTDGQDRIQTTFLENILWPFFRANQVDLHVIGYSDYHDVDTMKQLIRDDSGIRQHSFQYADSEDKLNDAIANVANLASPTLTFDLFGEKVILAADGGEVLFFAPKVGDGVTNVIVTAADANYKANLVLNTLEEPQALLDLALIGHQIQALARKPEKKQAQELDKALTALTPHFIELKRLERKRALTTSQQHREVLTSILALLAKGVHASTSDKARVLQTASAIRTRTNAFNKRLDVRLLKNEDLRSQIEAKVEQEIKALKLKEAPESADHYTCPLSFSNWFEALQDQDCMCVSLIVTRPPSAIAQPAFVRVQRVNYQCMTMEAFKMALDTGLIKWHNEIEAHGGFDPSKHKATVIKDRAIQPCNAVFPLFIGQRHWSSAARHYMKLALGWMATLDERGYSAAQWQTIPLLVYGWFLTHARDEVATVHKDYMGRVGVTVKKMLGGDKYLTTLKTQLAEPNRENLPNPILLFAAAKLYDIVLTPESVQRLFLEMVRRNVRKLGNVQLRTQEDVLIRLRDLLHLTRFMDIGMLQAWDTWSFAELGEKVMPGAQRHALKQADWIVPYMAAVNGVSEETIKEKTLTLSMLQHHAVLAWALWHSLDDKTRDDLAPDPFEDPEACLRYFVEKVKADWEARRKFEIQKAKSIAAGNAYVSSNNSVFNYSGHHMFNGKDFKLFLKTIRLLHASNAPPGTLVNARVKYDHLRAKGWCPSNRNDRAFRSQFTDEYYRV